MAHKPPTPLNIRTRLLLMCLAVAAPLLIISTYSIWKQYQTLHNEARRSTTFQAAMAVRALNHWITAQEDGLHSLASLTEIKRLDPWASQQILSTAAQAQADWHGLALVDVNGNSLTSTSNLEVFNPGDLRNQAFFKRLLKTRRPSMSGYVTCPISGQPALIAGAPVVVGKEVKAVVVACIDPRSVLRLFQGLGERNGSVIAIVDENNRLVARTLANELWAGRDWTHSKTVTAAQKVRRGTIEAVGIADPTPRTYAFDRVPANQWLVVVGVPTHTIYGSAHDWLIMMVMLAGCAIGLSIALAYLSTGYFTKPLNQMVRESLAIGRGDLAKRVEVKGGDELGLLARAFNQMAARLEVSQEHKLMIDNISDSIRKSLDLDKILNTTVSELGAALGASRCCLALIDARSPSDLADDQLAFDYLWWDEGRNGSPLKNRCIRVTDSSLLKGILEQGRVLSLDALDVGESPLFENTENYPDDWRSIKSLIACPISNADRPLGLILLHQCDSHRTWTEAEQELIQAIATHVALAMEHANLYAQTRKLAEQEMLTNHIVRAVRGSLDLDTILNTVTRELGEALGVDRCQIAQPHIDGPLIVSHEYHVGDLNPVKGLSIYGQRLDFHPADDREPVYKTVLGLDLSQLRDNSETGANATLNDAPLAVISDVEADDRTAAFSEFVAEVGIKSLITAPLLDNNRLLGVLMVHQCRDMRDWKPVEMSLVAAVADQVAVAISHAQLFAQVRHQAITDGLTGLYNHIYVKKRLNEELRRSERRGSPCSLLMIDLDKLKQINDGFGHPVGDAAIRQVAWTLKNLLRSGDTAARYGGEEFAVILPDTPLAEAALIADRLCRQVNGKPVTGLGAVSVSIGAATFPGQADTLEELIERADKALYQAKNSGRNRVCVWRSEPEPKLIAIDLKDREPTVTEKEELQH